MRHICPNVISQRSLAVSFVLNWSYLDARLALIPFYTSSSSSIRNNYFEILHFFPLAYGSLFCICEHALGTAKMAAEKTTQTDESFLLHAIISILHYCKLSFSLLMSHFSISFWKNTKYICGLEWFVVGKMQKIRSCMNCPNASAYMGFKTASLCLFLCVHYDRMQ